jgi:hypothetical protein
MKYVFSQQIFEKHSNIKFYENLSSGSKFVACWLTQHIAVLWACLIMKHCDCNRQNGLTFCMIWPVSADISQLLLHSVCQRHRCRIICCMIDCKYLTVMLFYILSLILIINGTCRSTCFTFQDPEPTQHSNHQSLNFHITLGNIHQHTMRNGKLQWDKFLAVWLDFLLPILFYQRPIFMYLSLMLYSLSNWQSP